jgi:hypothetical protein
MKIFLKKPLFEDLYIWHKVAAGTFLILAIAAVLLMNDRAVSFDIVHQTADGLLSQNTTVFAQAQRTLVEPTIRTLLVVVLGLSFVAVFFNSHYSKYKKTLESKVNLRRWLGIGITGALMIEIVGMLHGVADTATLKLMAGSVVVTALLGWVAETQNKGARRPEWAAFYLSLATGVMAWIPVKLALLGTLLYGTVRSPWYVYAATGAVVIGFCAMAYTQWWGYKTRPHYYILERNYLVVDTLTKVVFSLCLIIGLQG